MPLSFSTGKTFSNGETVTPSKINQAVNQQTYTGELEVAKGGTGASTASGARTNLNIFGSNLNSTLASAINVTQAGSLGGDLVFTATNAPTVSLTTGTWLVIGSVVARTSDNTDAVWAQFYNNTDGTAFGGSGAVDSNISALLRKPISVVGLITVASGTKVIYFKVFRAGSSTLDVGSAIGPAGFIQAVKLYE